MNTNRGRTSLTVAGAVALALAAASAGAQDVQKLDEIIVTAQKRNEALADIPMSVSVVGASWAPAAAAAKASATAPARVIELRP